MAVPVKVTANVGGQGERDRGAIAAIFAVLLGTGALLGMLALSFDIGVVYLESRTVQVGADSASQAVAQKCALHSDQCQDQSSAESLADSLVDGNAADGRTGIEELCGVAPLATCDALTARVADCVALQFPDGRPMPIDMAFARVTTRTETADGSAVRTVFSDLLDGQGGNDPGVTLWSCAQAVWGKVPSADVRVPLLIGACDYVLSGQPTVMAAFPPDPRPASRPVPLGRDCANDVYSTSGQITSQAFTGVANGFAPVTLGDSTCSSEVPVDVADSFSLRIGDVRSLCGATVGDFADFLDELLALDGFTPGGLYLRYPVAGTFTQAPAPNDDDVVFDVITFASYRLLGYSLLAPRGSGSPVDYIGGQVPPGGWDAYPVGADPVSSCAQRSCLYGQFGTYVVPRDRISVDATIPNMGVQAVEPVP